MADSNEAVIALLRAQLAVLGRIAFRDDAALEEVVCKGRDSGKQRNAYNLCDGTRTQSEVAKAAKIDGGNFSRTVGRWVEAGVLFKIPDGSDAKLQHIFSLPVTTGKASK
jgi:hypothetical protein